MEVFYEFRNIHQGNTRLWVSFLIKMHDFGSVTLDNTVKFLTTAVLKNFCEQLLLRCFPFMLV